MIRGTPDNTVAQRFSRISKQYPKRPLLNVLLDTANHYAITPGEITYETVNSEVKRHVNAFHSQGYTAGQRILLLLENRPDFFIYFLAFNQLGLSVVPINPDLKITELRYLINHSRACLAISVSTHIELLREAVEAADWHMPVIAIGESPPPLNSRAAVALSQSDPSAQEAALLYTSGTTGNPKGCVLSNTYFLECGDWYATTGGLCAISDDHERMITPLPLFHMNAFAVSFMAMLTVGGCLISLDRFHPKSWWRDVHDSKATCLHYLGVMPSILMQANVSEFDNTHSVRFGFGAGIDPNLHQPFEDRFGFPLIEAWAMTETGCGAVIAANQPPRLIGQSVIGRPDSSIEIKLVDDHGLAVGKNSPGELLVRRAGEHPRRGFFSEYYNDPDATAAAWKDGWFHTGDIVSQNDAGYMVFVDRKKNVIRRSGENIAAVEVEAMLMQHPQIDSAAVAAVPDPIRGDEVFACIKTQQTPSTELAIDIVTWCLNHSAYYKAPGYIAFVKQLPLTSTQKIQRGVLKKLVISLLDDPATVCTIDLKKRQGV